VSVLRVGEYHVKSKTAEKHHIARLRFNAHGTSDGFMTSCGKILNESIEYVRVKAQPNVCGVCIRREREKRSAELHKELRRLEKWDEEWGGSSNDDGHCRHGKYVGGSGIDWMCGYCEQYGIDEEMRELRKDLDELWTN
jgi:hypothetical protein